MTSCCSFLNSVNISRGVLLWTEELAPRGTNFIPREVGPRFWFTSATGVADLQFLKVYSFTLSFRDIIVGRPNSGSANASNARWYDI